jgi:hypothetical protein
VPAERNKRDSQKLSGGKRVLCLATWEGSEKEAQGRCCPGLPFPRLLTRIFAFNQSGSVWQDRGDKMARKQKLAGVARITQR